MQNEKIKVAINGFGRIGRAFLKLAFSRPEIEVVAINDLGESDNLAYLLKYDSVYGRSEFDVQIHSKDDQTFLLLDGIKKVFIFSEKEPKNLPWKEHEIDVVVESTGFFTDFEAARDHIKAGAKRVVISAPAKGEETDTQATVLLGINEDKFYTCPVTSNASCTTNSATPVIQILEDTIGIEKALLNTVHAYTATQSVIDGPGKKDWRGGRAAGLNIIPATTGAAKATTLAVTSLKDKFDGISLRVPVPAGSIADITFISKRATTVEEVNHILLQASLEDRWKNLFTIVEDPIVSQDIVGNPHASIADLSMTRVVGGNLVKVLAWYDNEVGYTNSLVEHVVRAGSIQIEKPKKVIKKKLKIKE
jgi:glyceraldehyde 3-phosphate dehydrogenase